jgi:leucyl aminopeptidase
VPEGVDAERVSTIADAVALGRDLINTPTSDLGPEQLEDAFLTLADRFSASARVVRGNELLDQNFPMIHAVGRASDQEPRLLEMTWGDESLPKVTLVGKGVCFDTGGLDIKPPSSMGLMKKDMGGAANVMALASMVMALGLPVRLRVLIPAVENSISAGAFRPGDVLTSRKGLTVEVNNTDAEGRLVLADALALADEEAPDLMVCMATLTGAARVALGPDLPPFYTRDEALASDIASASEAANDPLWRMPLWAPYESMIEPEIADLDNAPSGGMAGSVTAALFLARFVEATQAFAHFDIYGWTPAAKPARPKGGAVQGPLALLRVIEKRFGSGK